MSVPLRRDNPEEELSTADLAQSKRPAVTEELRPAPVLAEVKSTVPAEKATPDVRYASEGAPLFPNSELEDLRNRWKGVQTAFVDEPCRAVEQADGLVAFAMKRLADVFAQERSNGNAVPTSPPKTSASRSNAIVRFFIGCCPSNPSSRTSGDSRSSK